MQNLRRDSAFYLWRLNPHSAKKNRCQDTAQLFALTTSAGLSHTIWLTWSPGGGRECPALSNSNTTKNIVLCTASSASEIKVTDCNINKLECGDQLDCIRSRTCSIVSCTSYFLKEAPSISGGSTESGVDVSSSDDTVSSKIITRPLGGLCPRTGHWP